MSSSSIPAIGDVIGGRYQIQSIIASGGMGVVMRGQHVRMGRDVAIKFLHAHLIQDTDIRQRFEREVDIAKDLTHRNVVHVYDYGETNSGNLYLVMEYLEGNDLKHVLRQAGRFNAGRALNIMTQILDGLAEAHIRNVVHRDLKPANIFMTTDRHGDDLVKILDFGIAKSLQADQGITKAGTLCGTVAYMAPEAILAGGDTPSCDVYAAGLILLEMLTGTRAFRGETVAQTMMMQLQHTAPVPARLENTPLGQLIRQATNKDAIGRFKDADGMLFALRKIANQIDPNFRLNDDEVPTNDGEAANSSSDLYRPQPSRPTIPIPSLAKRSTIPPGMTPGSAPDVDDSTQHIALDDVEWQNITDHGMASEMRPTVKVASLPGDFKPTEVLEQPTAAQIASASPAVYDPLTPAQQHPTPVPGPAPIAVSPASTSSTSTALHHKPKSSSKTIGLIAGATLLGVAVVAGVVFMAADTDTPDQPTPTPAPTTVAAAELPTEPIDEHPVPTSPEASEVPDAPEARVFNIETTPDGADLFLGRIPLGNSPVTVTVESDKLPAQLRMVLDGYHEQSQFIDLDSSDTLFFELEQIPSEPEKSAQAASKKPPADSPPTRQPARQHAPKEPAQKQSAPKETPKKPSEPSVDDLLKQYLD